MSMHCHATSFVIAFNMDVFNLVSYRFKCNSHCVEQPLLGCFVERIDYGLERS